MAISKIIGASVADDAIDVSDLGTIMSVGETAPSSPFIGQRWYRASTAITYQYTNDGTSSFWLDVSSGGIGRSADRRVDFVGDIDPHKATNGSGLAVGSVYYNREKNRHFVCTDNTTDANVWAGQFAGAGGIVTDYLLSGTYYRVHTFLTSGVFTMEDTTSCDILVVAGGGGGGGAYDTGSGGGGAGGFRTQAGLSVTKGLYDITVGAGGKGGLSDGSASGGQPGTNGGNSQFGTVATLLSTGGGGGGAYSKPSHTGAAAKVGCAGGSGGGGSHGSAGGAASPTTSPVQGFAGGTNAGQYNAGSGGGGATAAGVNAPNATNAGAGGAGATNAYRTGSNITYAGGGGGGVYQNNTVGAGGAGGGGAGNKNGEGHGVAGTDGLGGGGGGTGGGTGAFQGGSGGSGIVVIRYAIS